MARRRRGGEEELPFSLDSFLDIVANLVGILIRLIVMVGLSVRALPGPSQQLRDAADANTEAAYAKELEEWKRKSDDIEKRNAAAKTDHDAKRGERDRELADRRQAKAALEDKQKKLDEEYDARKRALAERLAVLHAFEKQAAELADDVAVLNARKSKEADLLDRELAAAHRLDVQAEDETKSLSALKAEIEAAQRELDSERVKRESLDDQIADLRRMIAEIEAQPKPVKKLVHDATAIASRVEIDEIHYRIKNGRIAATYMSDMLDQLRVQVQLAMRDRAEIRGGTIGPVGGFTLHYEIDRSRSPLGDRVHSGSAWNVNLKRFHLTAESDDLGERCAEAAQDGSALLRSLEKVEPAKKVVTCWVYPDSFAEAKTVETALHQRGFAVAMRPMPEGAQISGSPSGTSSEAR